MGTKTKDIILAVLAIGIVGLIVVNAIVTKPETAQAWSKAMTKGSDGAERHFIFYTDIFCPYCDNYSRVLIANLDEFQRDYLDNNQVYYELRLTDMISDHSVNSKRGGEAGYCVADQGNFWNFYEEILAKLKKDYHDKGIGTSKTAPKIPQLDDYYYYDAVEKAGDLDIDQFKTCMDENQMLETLNNNTLRASRIAVQGLPYFVFGDWTGSGFDGDWNTIKSMFRAGGVR